MGEYNLAEARMLVIWRGALFVLGGLLFMMAQPIWRGRLSEARRRRSSSAVPRDTAMKTAEPMTLEPRRPGRAIRRTRSMTDALGHCAVLRVDRAQSTAGKRLRGYHR